MQKKNLSRFSPNPLVDMATVRFSNPYTAERASGRTLSDGIKGTGYLQDKGSA